jgi:hypothetical protein
VNWEKISAHNIVRAVACMSRHREAHRLQDIKIALNYHVLTLLFTDHRL